MKRNIVFGFMVLSLLAFCRIAGAENLDFSTTKWEVSGQLGANIPTQSGSDAGGYLMGRLTYDLTPNIAIGATTGWTGYKIYVDGDNWGNATSIPLLGTVILKMPIESTQNRLVPYLVGGLGVAFWSLDESSLLKDNAIKVEDETSFAAQFGAGVDYFLTDRFAVFGEVSYLMTGIDTSISAPGLTGTLKGDTDSVLVGVGAKARF